MSQYHVYLLAAAFVLLTVGSSFYLNYRLSASFETSVLTDEAWVGRLDEMSEITALAALVNAPGNDVFETGEVEKCSSRFENSYEEFLQAVIRGRKTMAHGARESARAEISQRFDVSIAYMEQEAREARAIFSQFRNGDRVAAGSHMSAMDRASQSAVGTLGFLAARMRAAQHEDLRAQQGVVAGLRQTEFWIAIMNVLMVIGVGIYCRLVMRSTHRHHRELEEVRFALNATQDRLFSFDIDSHEVRFANRAAKESVNRSDCSMPTLAQLLPNLDAVGFMQKIKDLVEGEDSSLSYKCRLPGISGGSFPAEVSLTYVSDSDSRKSCLVLIRDIGERERAGRKLELYKKAVDEHSIVAITDRKGCITFVNEKFIEISQYSRKELIGQDHRLLNSGHHPQQFWVDMYQTIHSGRTWQGQVKNRAKDGSFYWVDTTIVPECDENGTVTGFIAFRKEVTELKHAEESIIAALDQAESASQVKSEFLANMSHEIRTPMTAILGYADLLSEENLDPQTHCEHVATIQRNGEHLLTIINDILDLSKIEAGKMTVERIETSLVSVVDDVVDLMRVRAEGKNLALRVEYITPVPAVIISDEVRLRQILMNLVGNAIKFTEKGAVTIAVAFDGEGQSSTISVAVRDTGIGMTEEQVSRMFTAFGQADATTTRRFGGTGLGLAISQRLAEMLNGEISVTSVVGEGSTFTLKTSAKLPEGAEMLAEHGRLPGQAKTGGKSEPSAPKASLAGCRILLAEDGPDNQMLISFVLRKVGASVEIAENGRLAVEAVAGAEARGEPFDLVLMDMQMPEMDGLTATAALRDQGRSIPIVALTAHAMASDRELCLKSGCDDFATKPINRPKLIELCRKLGCESTEPDSM